MSKSITGEQSKDARSALNVSQGQVSQQTGIARAYLSQFENGIRRLPLSEQSTLRSYYEDEGFVFTESHGEQVALVSKEVVSVQEEISHQVSSGGNVTVPAIELSNLVSQVEDLISHMDMSKTTQASDDSQDDGSDSFKLAVSNPGVFSVVSEAFEEQEKRLLALFTDDKKGTLRSPSFFHHRDDRVEKILHVAGVQYLRMFAMKNGVSLIPLDGMKGLKVISDNDEAKSLSKLVGVALSASNPLDDYFISASA